MHVSEELERLAALRDRGVLTDAEFEQQKSKLLAGNDVAINSPSKSNPGAIGSHDLATVKRGLIIAGGIFLVMVVIAMFSAPSSTSSPVPSFANETSEQITQPVKVNAKADLKSLYDTMLAEASQCDRPNSAAADAVSGLAEGRGTTTEAYSLANDAHRACEQAWLNIGKLEPANSFNSAEREKAAKALKTCELAYFARKQSLEKLMTVLDGDMRPSQVTAFTEAARDGQLGLLACVAAFVEVGAAVGVELSPANKQS